MLSWMDQLSILLFRRDMSADLWTWTATYLILLGSSFASTSSSTRSRSLSLSLSLAIYIYVCVYVVYYVDSTTPITKPYQLTKGTGISNEVNTAGKSSLLSSALHVPGSYDRHLLGYYAKVEDIS
jgi:hypothetical protein